MDSRLHDVVVFRSKEVGDHGPIYDLCDPGGVYVEPYCYQAWGAAAVRTPGPSFCCGPMLSHLQGSFPACCVEDVSTGKPADTFTVLDAIRAYVARGVCAFVEHNVAIILSYFIVGAWRGHRLRCWPLSRRRGRLWPRRGPRGLLRSMNRGGVEGGSTFRPRLPPAAPWALNIAALLLIGCQRF